jgi:hypothetical protein
MSRPVEGYRILKETGAVARLDESALENGRVLRHAYTKGWSAAALASVLRREGGGERSAPKPGPVLLERPARALVAEVVRRRGGKPKFTDAQRRRAKLLKKRGQGYKEIARFLGCSHSTAWSLVNDRTNTLPDRGRAAR